jgi:hypothetical protein
MASFKHNGAHNFTFYVSGGITTNSNGTILDISGIGADLSGTQMLKIAPIDNKDSFYTLLDLSNNTIETIDCSGSNIIRVTNGVVLGVGYISNPSSVSSFVCDTSGNLWVGGNAMSVKTNNAGSAVDNAESMFIIPFKTPTQPTAFVHVDVSGCNDICPVRNLMVASVYDVSGRCLNFASGSSSVTVDSTVFPRLNAATSAFQTYISPRVGGKAIDDSAYTDVSGHRLVAFARSGTTGYDVSGFYVLRQNTTNGNGVTPSTVTGIADVDAPGIRYDISLNKIAFEKSTNNLYVGTNANTYATSKLLIVPLDVSSNVITTHDISFNALFAYAEPTSSTAGDVDGSGFMFICPNPSQIGTKVLLDSSGVTFDTLTVSDVSGVNAMATVMASDGTSNYNYLYLVDASRNTVGATDFNTKLKLALIKLSTRRANDGNYLDGSGISFVFSNSSNDFPISSSYIRDIRVDADGNVFLAGHQIYTITDTTTVNEIADALTVIGISGSVNIAALVSGAYTNNIDLLEAADPNLSVSELAKKIYKLPTNIN